MSVYVQMCAHMQASDRLMVLCKYYEIYFYHYVQPSVHLLMSVSLLIRLTVSTVKI